MIPPAAWYTRGMSLVLVIVYQKYTGGCTVSATDTVSFLSLRRELISSRRGRSVDGGKADSVMMLCF